MPPSRAAAGGALAQGPGGGLLGQQPHHDVGQALQDLQRVRDGARRRRRLERRTRPVRLAMRFRLILRDRDMAQALTGDGTDVAAGPERRVSQAQPEMHADLHQGESAVRCKRVGLPRDDRGLGWARILQPVRNRPVHTRPVCRSHPEREDEAIGVDETGSARPATVSRRRLSRAAGAASLLTGISPLGLAGCSPVGLLNALAPDRLAASGIAYGPDVRQRLDVYRPAGAGPFPVAMFVYGGNWEAGSRAMYRFVGGALAEAGIVAIVPDYRLYPAIRYPVFVQDCAAAFAWTRRNATRLGGDARPPCLIGHSAGAYNVAMLTLDARWLRAAGLEPARDIRRTVGLAGPYDFLPLGSAMLRDLFSPAPAIADTQPIAHVDGHNPPMLLLAGSADTTVRPANSTRLAAAIHRAGGQAAVRIYRGVDHREIIGAFAAPLRFLAPSLADTVRFVQERGVGEG